MSIRNLDHLFQPRSIAVIGASNRAGSVGASVMNNLVQGGFAGSIVPVNPKYGAVAGLAACSDVSHLSTAPDLAVVCTPPSTVPGVIKRLGKLGTRAAIVLTPGFPDEPKEQGAKLQQAMLDAARPYLLRILGPNGMGLIVPGRGLNASLAGAAALPGKVAFVSQSGALASAVLDWATSRNTGFSKFISVGNSADIDVGDLLDYLGSDPDTRAILLYIESIKPACARKFMSAARAASRNKPVILVKAGRSPEGARAANTRASAMAGPDMVFDAAIRRAGMLRVNSTQDLFGAIETLARTKPALGDSLLILSNGGGPGLMASDALGMGGGRLASLSPETRQALQAVLPRTWSRANPIDILGDAPVERYVKAFDAILNDGGSDTVLFIHAPTAMVASRKIADACAPLLTKSKRNVLGCWLGGDGVAGARQVFNKAGVPVYETPEEAVQAFLYLLAYRRNQALLLETVPSEPNGFLAGAQQARRIVQAAMQGERSHLDQPEVKAVLKGYGIPVSETSMAGAGQAAACIAQQPGFQAGVPPRAHELMLGVTTDPTFGPVILFGHGGSAAEVINDRSVALPPLNRVLAQDLVSRTRVASLLQGYRETPKANLDALYGVLVALSQLVIDIPELVELDINPLLLDESGAVAMDARMRVQRATADGSQRLAIRPYPRELEESAEQGELQITLRPILPSDSEPYQEFLRQLSAEDARNRFFQASHQLPKSELARVTQIDYDRQMTIVAVDAQGEGVEILGELRLNADPDNQQAELGIAVRSDVQCRGLGSRLLDKGLSYCRDRGTIEIIGTVLASNTRMLDLARKFGFSISTPHDCIVDIRRVLNPQTRDAP